MNVILYSSVIFGCSYVSENIRKIIKSLNLNLKSIAENKIYSISEFINEINNNIDLFNPIRRNNDDEIKTSKVFLKGIVKCDFPIKSILKKGVSLIYNYFCVDFLYSNDNYMDKLNQINSELLNRNHTKNFIENASPFFYLEDNNSLINCIVKKNLDAKIIGAHSLLGQRFYYKNLTFLEKIMSFLAFTIDLLNSKYNFFTARIRGIKTGYFQSEYGIRVKSEILVYGEIIYNFKTKIMKISKPIYFLKNKRLLIQFLKGKNSKYKFFLFAIYLFIGILSFFLIKEIKHLINYYLQIRKKRKDDKLSNVDHVIVCQQKCYLCKKNLNEIILLPCKHLCICGQCFKGFFEKNKPNCPICKKNVLSYVKLYLS